MKEIKFVDIGEGITEGHIQKWLVNDGDDVKEDQAVVQIETDKAIVNIPSPIDGRIKIVAKEDTDVAYRRYPSYNRKRGRIKKRKRTERRADASEKH